MLLNDTPIKTTASFHNDLLMAKELVYDKSGFEFQNYKLHSESTDYGACSFELNGNKVQYRVSKITPTKKGQFVTIWKRSDSGITVPFDVLDDVDLVIISTRCGEHFGQFIFPKSVLAEKGIMRQNGKEGKRGIRVYTFSQLHRLQRLKYPFQRIKYQCFQR